MKGALVMTLRQRTLGLTLTLFTISLLSLALWGSLKSPPTIAPRLATGESLESPHFHLTQSLSTTPPGDASTYTSLVWSPQSTEATCSCSQRTTLIVPLVGSSKQSPQCLMSLKPVQATLTRERWTKSTITCLQWE